MNFLSFSGSLESLVLETRCFRRMRFAILTSLLTLIAASLLDIILTHIL